MRLLEFPCKVAMFVCVFAGLTLSQSKAALSAPTIISFDPPGSTWTAPNSLNKSGQVTGSYTDTSGIWHGFLRGANGTITSFDPTGSTSTFSNGINSGGTITGYYNDPRGYGFIRNTNGNFTTFDASYGGSGLGTYPVAISDRGEVVGSSKDAANNNHSFLRYSNGQIVNFDPPGAEESWAVGIGPNGEILGEALLGNFYGYIRSQSGVITTFTVPGDQNGTLPASINQSGQIAGFYYDKKNVTHGFVRDQFGNFTTFDAPGGGTQNSQGTLAYGINDAGEITGYVLSSSNHATAFLRDASGAITLFHAPAAGTGRGQGTYSYKVNLSGDTTGSYFDATGVYHGFFSF